MSYRSSGEKLIYYQANSSSVIMSVILMTTLFYKALILQGEIWCWSLLGLKGLKGELTTTCVFRILSSSASCDSNISDVSRDSFSCCNWLRRLSYLHFSSAFDSSIEVSCQSKDIKQQRSLLVKSLSHAIFYLLIKLKSFLALIQFWNYSGPVVLFKTIFWHWNSFLSSIATDGQDEHGLKLEKVGPSFNAMLAKITKNILWFVLPDENCLISSS